MPFSWKRLAYVLAPAIFSMVCGFVAHLMFFPLVESWRNGRMQRLGRPGVGVVANVLPFLVYRSMLRQGQETGDRALQDDLSAYLLSFGWNGIGVVLGYFFDDFRKGRQGEF